MPAVSSLSCGRSMVYLTQGLFFISLFFGALTAVSSLSCGPFHCLGDSSFFLLLVSFSGQCLLLLACIVTVPLSSWLKVCFLLVSFSGHCLMFLACLVTVPLSSWLNVYFLLVSFSGHFLLFLACLVTVPLSSWLKVFFLIVSFSGHCLMFLACLVSVPLSSWLKVFFLNSFLFGALPAVSSLSCHRSIAYVNQVIASVVGIASIFVQFLEGTALFLFLKAMVLKMLLWLQ